MIARIKAKYDEQPKPTSRVHASRRVSTDGITIDRALADPNLLGAALVGDDPASWYQWRAVLRAAFGLPLDADDLDRFHAVAGDRAPPTQRVSELWAVVSRRAGKTRMAAGVSVFVATLCKHRLAPGEIGYVLLLAASRDQAGIALEYVIAFLEQSPILRQLIETITASEVRLKNGVIIAVHTNSYRTLRGKSLLLVVGDETSYWRSDDSAVPDLETYRACIPALAATGGMWIAISSGYRKMGLLYSKWRDFFGQESSDTLVVQGSTATFNPTFDVNVIAKAKANDPEVAESEWNGGWRNDISAFLDDETIDAAIEHSRPLELPPRKDITYQAFSDASGGRRDFFTICLGHRDGDDKFICDVIRGRKPPFDPNDVGAEYAALLKEYRVSKLVGDNYSAAWVETAWRSEGITYELSELPKSGLYLESLPLFVRGIVSMPDHPVLTRELRLLERRTSRAGKDVVDHGKTGTDDFSNALCGLLYLLSKKSSHYRYDASLNWVMGDVSPEEASRSWQKDQLFNFMLSPSWGGRGRKY